MEICKDFISYQTTVRHKPHYPQWYNQDYALYVFAAFIESDLKFYVHLQQCVNGKEYENYDH
jgi:hypothetical protein